MGEALQEELIAAIKDSGARVIGPNTTGHVSVPGRYTSSFFPLGPVRRGSVSYIAQTGNFCGISLRHILSAENYGIARSCGLGNKADLDECDLLEFYGRGSGDQDRFFSIWRASRTPSASSRSRAGSRAKSRCFF